jgi:hypothetical protein
LEWSPEFNSSEDIKKSKMKRILIRLAFILLSTITMVFFSEKVFWYVQGYSILELVLFYAIPVAVCITVLDLFQVHRLSGLVLVGGLFGFLVEGALTPVIYEAGLLDPIMPAYFVGWHGLLSLVVGWYLIRKFLVERQWKHLVVLSLGIGIFWGVWSLAYRLPESVREFQALVEAGEQFIPGAWPVGDFALYSVVFSALLAAAHWLLAQGFWQREFTLQRWEMGLLAAILVLLYLAQVFPTVPLGFLKLAGLIALVILPLRMVNQGSEKPSVLVQLDRSIPAKHVAPLMAIPVAASLVYALAEVFPPPEDWLRGLYITIYSLQALAGGSLFLWAWVDSIKVWKKNRRIKGP